MRHVEGSILKGGGDPRIGHTDGVSRPERRKWDGNVERMRGGGASGKVKLAQGVPLYVVKVEEMKDADESRGGDPVAGEGEGRD
jgi:hypothetical protein